MDIQPPFTHFQPPLTEIQPQETHNLWGNAPDFWETNTFFLGKQFVRISKNYAQELERKHYLQLLKSIISYSCQFFSRNIICGQN